MSERDPAELAAWIRANRAAYTREALEQAMAGQGWSADEIRSAWGIVDAGTATSEWTRADAGGGGLTERRAGLVLVAILLLVMTSVAVFTEAAMRSVSGPGGFAMPALFWIFVTVAIPAAAFIALARSGRRLGCAGMFAFVAVIGLVIFGTCVATLAVPYPIP